MKNNIKENNCPDCGESIFVNKHASNKTRCNICKEKNYKIKYEKIKENKRKPKGHKKKLSEEHKKKLSIASKKYYKKNPNAINNLSIFASNRTIKQETKDKLSKINKKRCENINERIRLREIGRKGGFGKRGITNSGTKYESNLEKKCFEYLEENKIKFEAHKPIPCSSKVSDIYLIENNIWIEIDGINREKNKEWLKEDYNYWLEKLKIYKNNKLNFYIIYTYNEFINLIGRLV